MDAAEFIAGTYAEIGGIQECGEEIRKAIADAVAEERMEIEKIVMNGVEYFNRREDAIGESVSAWADPFEIIRSIRGRSKPSYTAL